LQAANGASSPVKAPRKRTAKVAAAKAAPAEAAATESPAAKDLSANPLPSGDDRAA